MNSNTSRNTYVLSHSWRNIARPWTVSKYSAIFQSCDHWPLEKVNRHLWDERAALGRTSLSVYNQFRTLYIYKLSPISSIRDLAVRKKLMQATLKIAPYQVVDRVYIGELSCGTVSIAAEAGSRYPHVAAVKVNGDAARGSVVRQLRWRYDNVISIYSHASFR